VIDRARCPVPTFQEWAVAPPFRLRAEPGGPPRRVLVPTLVGLVPPALVETVSAHVRRGEPGTVITSYVEVTAPAFVILGEHARGFIRRFLTPATTQAVVRRIHCPAWVIPASSGT
jgi:nucleotide-binding universal stress UspA family protein